MDVQLIREVAAMITNIRNITNQNLAMQKLLMQMQGQEGHLIPLYRSQGQYLQKDAVQSQMASSSRHSRRISPMEQKQELIFPSTMSLVNPPRPHLAWKIITYQNMNQEASPEDLEVYLMKLAPWSQSIDNLSNLQNLKIGHNPHLPRLGNRRKGKNIPQCWLAQEHASQEGQGSSELSGPIQSNTKVSS